MIIDVTLLKGIPESDVMEWTTQDALRRHDLILSQLTGGNVG